FRSFPVLIVAFQAAHCVRGFNRPMCSWRARMSSRLLNRCISHRVALHQALSMNESRAVQLLEKRAMTPPPLLSSIFCTSLFDQDQKERVERLAMRGIGIFDSTAGWHETRCSRTANEDFA